jgi:hypothetical protein
MGLAADQAHTRRAAECTHEALDRGNITVTNEDFQKGHVPDCDMNPDLDREGVYTKHPSVKAPEESFSVCNKCNMIICDNCNVDESMILLIIGDVPVLRFISLI